jgi:hypothetical protein
MNNGEDSNSTEEEMCLKQQRGRELAEAGKVAVWR